MSVSVETFLLRWEAGAGLGWAVPRLEGRPGAGLGGSEVRWLGQVVLGVGCVLSLSEHCPFCVDFWARCLRIQAGSIFTPILPVGQLPSKVKANFLLEKPVPTSSHHREQGALGSQGDRPLHKRRSGPFLLWWESPHTPLGDPLGVRWHSACPRQILWWVLSRPQGHPCLPLSGPSSELPDFLESHMVWPPEKSCD